MNPETIKAISDALAPIAEKIGQGAQFGWEVVVRQQLIEGIQSLAELLVAVPLLIAFVILLRKYLKMKYESGKCWIFGMLSILCLLWVLFDLESGIGHLLNPNYYALQFFIDLAKPKY